MRRLLMLASAMIFFDVAFFAAIAPLLPDYVDELGLSKAQAGILSASYAAGTLLASLPAGLRRQPGRAAAHGHRRPAAARRLQPRLRLRSTRSRLLDAARFIQGIAGALIWSGALTWLITAAPDESRGSVIGTALGTAVAGALLGPALGALAAAVGTELVFGSVLVVTLGARLRRLAAARGRRARAPDACARSSAAMLSRPVLDGDRLRRRALGDVRRDRGAGAAADRRARRRPRA